MKYFALIYCDGGKYRVALIVNARRCLTKYCFKFNEIDKAVEKCKELNWKVLQSKIKRGTK